MQARENLIETEALGSRAEGRAGMRSGNGEGTMVKADMSIEMARSILKAGAESENTAESVPIETNSGIGIEAMTGAGTDEETDSMTVPQHRLVKFRTDTLAHATEQSRAQTNSIMLAGFKRLHLTLDSYKMKLIFRATSCVRARDSENASNMKGGLIW